MPPKQQSKADVAKKQKIVEDKTFGLKNKNKSKNVQKYVQSLQQSVQPKPDQSKIAAKVISFLFSSYGNRPLVNWVWSNRSLLFSSFVEFTNARALGFPFSDFHAENNEY